MGLIQEAKWTEGGHRLYDETVFGRLSRIIQLRKTKTLAEIKDILSEASLQRIITVGKMEQIQEKNNYKLGEFEGPLDLLLFLIRKNEEKRNS